MGKLKKIILSVLILFLFFSLNASSGLKEKIKNKLIEQKLSPELSVFIISMLPIFELRGSIPVGVQTLDLPWYQVFLISVLGNMTPIIFLLLLLGFLTKIFMKVPILAKLLEWIFKRTRSKSAIIEKYEELGLILFVAIPLPITGAWTGAFAAYLFGLNFWKSILCILIGVLMAAVIVTSLTMLGWKGAVIALIVLLTLIVSKIYSALKRKSTKK